MAQAAQTPEQASIADGATSTFPISFTFADPAEVRVSVDSGSGPVNQQPGSDFTVSGASIVFLPGKTPPEGARVARRRSTPVAQPEPFGDQMAFRPLANEGAFDRLTRIAQENRALAGRGIRTPVGEPGIELAPAADREGFVPLFTDGGLGRLDEPEVVVATNAEGRAYPLAINNLLLSIGVDLIDDGEWLGGLDPETEDDGVWG